MGLLKSLTQHFSKKNKVAEEVDFQQVQETGIRRKDMDFHDRQQRERYVKACLDQMGEASKELETLGYEYNLVTSYLTDMEEIDAMPPEMREQLANCAKHIVELQGNQKKLLGRKAIMTDVQYLQMERISEYMPEGYDKLKEAEDYQVLVKKDLNRLDGEKHAYHFRRTELQTGQNNLKGMIAICVGAMAILLLILAVIGTTFHLDVELGCIIAVLVAAGAMTYVYVKFNELRKEEKKVDRAINKLILLQNTVKIRYVNNTNLLEYLYVKYNVDSSAQLKNLWDKYLEEKKQREAEQQVQSDIDFYQASLVKQLRKCKIQDPNIWLHQAVALYDNKEMVEIRHGLIIRRQKLRKQMEYNAKMAQDAQDEVKDVVQTFPEYAKKILELVSEYERALA
ncbi:MAG: hypothetical protein IJ326_00110 [Lachnospiraceae bacterium]|nr:hypothetical protein [Lachnospiraceae bacterium]